MLNLNLLSHIVLDSESRNRIGMEGNTFKNTFEYLNDFLESNVGKKALPQEEAENVKTLLNKIRYLVLFEDTIYQKNSDGVVNNLSERFIGSIRDLKPHDSVLLAGGWQNGIIGGGHAMIYEFEIDENNHLLFHIYNSGAGIQHHQKISQAEKEYYFHQKTYDLSDKYHVPGFKSLIEMLIANRIENHPKRTAIEVNDEKLYKDISSRIIMLKGEEILKPLTPENIQKTTTSGQLSGTCSQRCIHQMLKLQFKEHKNYQIFIFKFQMHALENYVNQPGQYSPIIANLLEKAVIRNLRHLINLKTMSFINETEVKEFKDRLQHISILINKKTPKIHNPFKQQLESLSSSQISSRINPALLRSFETSLNTSNPPPFPQIDIKNAEWVCVEKLKKVLENIHNNQQRPLYQLEQYNQLIDSLPLDISKYQPTQHPSMLIQVKKLLDNYQMVYDKNYRKNETPINIINLINVLTIYMRLLQELEQEHVHFINYLNKHFQSLLEKINSSALKTSLDKQTDQKLKLLTTLYPKDDTSITKEDIFEFYESLLSKDAALNKLCQELENSASGNKYKNLSEKKILKIAVMKEQFIEFEKKDDIEYKRIENIKELSQPEFRNSFASLENKKYWIPAFGEPIEIDPPDPDSDPKSKFFSFFKYRILVENSPLLAPEFEKTFLKFQQILDLETNFFQSISLITNRHKMDPRGEIYVLNNEEIEDHGPLSYLKNALFTNDYIKGTYLLDKRYFGYPLHVAPESLIHNRLYSKESNFIQTKHSIEKQDISFEAILLQRELSHLRTNLNHCASLSMSYFSEHLEKLSQANNQNYLLINLFQDVSKIDLQQFQDFIQDALKFHQDGGKNTETCIYSIGLQAKLYQYIEHRETINFIDMHIELEKNHQFKAILHAERFKALFNQLEKSPEEEEKLYISYLWMKNQYNSPPHQTLVEKHLLDTAVLKYQIQEKLLQPQQMKSLILSHLGLDESQFHIQFNHNNQTYFFQDSLNPSKSYTLDLNKGQLFTPLGVLGELPTFLRIHPLFIELGLDPNSLAFQNQNGTTFQLENPMIKLIADKDNQLICQKMINDVWYTFIPITDIIKKSFSVSNNCPSLRSIPKILQDADCRLWYDHLNNKSLLYHKETQLFEINSKGQLQGMLAIPELLLQFESPEYMFNKDRKVYLLRYGFTITDNCIDGSRLQITNAPKLLPENTAQLYCIDTKTQQKFCLVPIQAFYFDNNLTLKTDGHLAPLTHDISNTIITQILKEENLTLIARYQNSCEYYQFPIINGEIQAENAEMALYLCYIYLVNRDYRKANSILKTLDKIGFSGSEKELQFLNWILEKIPYPLPKQKDYSAVNPEEVACQLKAFCFFTQFINQGMTPRLNTIKPDQSEESGYYQAIIQKDAQSIYSDLVSHVLRLIDNYQQRKRHTQIEFLLSDRELLCMTRYLCSQMETLNGSLSYLHQSLELKQIQQHIKNLQALNQTAQNRQKLEKLESKLTQAVQVRTKISHFQTHQINFSIDYSNLTYAGIKDTQRYISIFYNDLLRFNENQTKAMTVLGYDMGLDVLIEHFTAYTQIAFDPKNLNYQTLRDFLTQYIRSQYHTPPNKQKNNFLAWCIFLYRVSDPCIQSLNLKEIKVCNFLNETKKLNFEPIYVTSSQDNFIDEAIDPLRLIENLSPKANETIHIKPFTLDNKYCFDDLQKNNSFKSIYQQIIEENQQLKTSLENAKTEEEAGKALLNYRNQINQVHYSAEQKEILKNYCLTLSQNITQELKWEDLLIEFNTVIKDALSLELSAQLRKTISQDDLIACYHQNDKAAYRELFNFLVSEEKIDELHQKIHYFMLLEINRQKANRLLQALENNIDQDITRIYSEENLAPNDPSLTVFQYKSNILLRPQQKQAIDILMQNGENSPESIQKVTMGGGKSKVLLPSLAKKKANGERLIIVEVPQPLLESNFRDLNQTSQELFQQKVLRFGFNRESDCSAKRLESIYHLFYDCMVQKNYIVTTGESMASMELKYLEILSFTPIDEDEIKEWQQQIDYLGRILKLLRSHGEALIDEVHQALWLKKQLNYTMGDKQAIDTVLIEESLKFYNFYVRLNETDRENIAQQLIEKTDTPLKNVLKKYTPDNILAFFNQEKSLENLGISNEDLAILAIYKTQIQLMPQTMAKNYREHYGPSKSISKNPLERCIAIPYLANEKPSERSIFAQCMETINYTIQSIHKEGLNLDLIEYLLQDFIMEARSEMLRSQSKIEKIDDTEIAKNINQIIKDTNLTLGTLEIKNKNHIQTIYNQLSKNKAFIVMSLQEKILPLISAEQAILQSNCYQHVDLYQRVQGFSGTPWNAATFHHRLYYDPLHAIGHDGFIQQCLIEKNTQVISHPDTINVETLLAAHPNPNLRAIIDVGAVFNGIDNLSIARQLKTHTSPAIQYILFYNEQDMLCALSKADDKMILIGKTDPITILQKLGCETSEYFTYYDQAHTVGADIAQFPKAHALCLVNEKTFLQNFLQAAMRMRQLSQEQTIDVCAPPVLAKHSLQDLMAHFSVQQEQSLKDDYIFAAVKQMKNTIFQVLINKVLEQEDSTKSKEMFEKYKAFFILDPIHDIYQRYGTIEKDQDTEIFLTNYQTHLLKDYEEISNAQISEEILNNLKDIKKKYLQLCPPQVKESSFEIGAEVEQEQEMEMEIEQEQELQKEMHNELFDPSIHAKTYQDLNINQLKPLNDYLPQELQIFDINLKCSLNYIETYYNQNSFLNAYLKPVHSLLIILKSDQIIMVIISEEDVARYKQTNFRDKQWIISTDGKVLKSNKPILNPKQESSYLKLLEQSRFFGGHLKALIGQNEAHLWLGQETHQKIKLFTIYLAPYREYKSRELKQIECLFSEKPKAIQYLFENILLKDLADFQWESVYKNLSKADIQGLKKLVNHINFRNQTSLELNKQQEIQEQYPLLLSKIQDYFSKLEKIDELLNIDKTSIFYFTELNKPENICEFEGVISHLRELNENLIDKKIEVLQRSKINLTEQFPFLSERFNSYFNKLIEVKHIISNIENTSIQDLKELAHTPYLPIKLLEEICKKRPTPEILNFIAKKHPQIIFSLNLSRTKQIEIFQEAKDYPELKILFIQSWIMQDKEKLLKKIKNQDQNLTNVLLEQMINTYKEVTEIKLSLQEFGLENKILNDSQIINYFIQYPEKFEDFMLKEPINENLTLASLNSDLHIKTWNLLQNPLFIQKENFKELMKNQKIELIYKVIENFQAQAFTEKDIELLSLLKECNILTDFRKKIQKYCENLINEKENEAPEDLLKIFTKQLENLEKTKIILQNLFKAPFKLEEHQTLNDLFKSLINIKETDNLIYLQYQWLEFLSSAKSPITGISKEVVFEKFFTQENIDELLKVPDLPLETKTLILEKYYQNASSEAIQKMFQEISTNELYKIVHNKPRLIQKLPHDIIIKLLELEEKNIPLILSKCNNSQKNSLFQNLIKKSNTNSLLINLLNHMIQQDELPEEMQNFILENNPELDWKEASDNILSAFSLLNFVGQEQIFKIADSKGILEPHQKIEYFKVNPGELKPYILDYQSNDTFIEECFASPLRPQLWLLLQDQNLDSFNHPAAQHIKSIIFHFKTKPFEKLNIQGMQIQEKEELIQFEKSIDLIHEDLLNKNLDEEQESLSTQYQFLAPVIQEHIQKLKKTKKILNEIIENNEITYTVLNELKKIFTVFQSTTITQPIYEKLKFIKFMTSNKFPIKGINKEVFDQFFTQENIDELLKVPDLPLEIKTLILEKYLDNINNKTLNNIYQQLTAANIYPIARLQTPLINRLMSKDLIDIGHNFLEYLMNNSISLDLISKDISIEHLTATNASRQKILSHLPRDQQYRLFNQADNNPELKKLILQLLIETEQKLEEKIVTYIKLNNIEFQTKVSVVVLKQLLEIPPLDQALYRLGFERNILNNKQKIQFFTFFPNELKPYILDYQSNDTFIEECFASPLRPQLWLLLQDQNLDSFNHPAAQHIKSIIYHFKTKPFEKLNIQGMQIQEKEELIQFEKSIDLIHEDLLNKNLDEEQESLSTQYQFLAPVIQEHIQKLKKTKVILNKIIQNKEEITNEELHYLNNIFTVFQSTTITQPIYEKLKFIEFMTRNEFPIKGISKEVVFEKFFTQENIDELLKVPDLPLENKTLILEKYYQNASSEAIQKMFQEISTNEFYNIVHNKPRLIQKLPHDIIIKLLELEEKNIPLILSKCNNSQKNSLFQNLIKKSNTNSLLVNLLNHMIQQDELPEEMQNFILENNPELDWKEASDNILSAFSLLNFVGQEQIFKIADSKGILKPHQKIEYFKAHQDEFVNYQLENPIDEELISKSLNDFRTQIWSLLQNPEFTKKEKFDLLLENNVQIKNIKNTLDQFHNNPYVKLEISDLKEEEQEFINHFKSNLDTIHTNLIKSVKSLDEIKTKLIKDYPQLQISIEKHVSHLKTLKEVIPVLLDPNQTISPDQQLKLDEIFPTNNNDNMQYLKYLLDNQLIQQDDLKNYKNSFNPQNSYPDWFLKMYNDNIKIQLKYLDNLLKSKNDNMGTLDTIIKNIININEPTKTWFKFDSPKDKSSLMIEFIKQHIENLRSDNKMNSEIKENIIKLGEYTTAALQKKNIKDKACFEIFIKVKHVMTNFDESKQKELLPDIINLHKEIIQKHQGIKKILISIYAILMKCLPLSEENYNLFKQTRSENIISLIQKSVKKDNPSN